MITKNNKINTQLKRKFCQCVKAKAISLFLHHICTNKILILYRGRVLSYQIGHFLIEMTDYATSIY